MSSSRVSGLCIYPRRVGAALCLLFLVVLPSCNANHTGNTPSASSAPQTTYPMPPVSIPSHTRAGTSQYGFTLLDNRRMGLSDYLGQVVVLDFWATWCQPCREETPNLVELQKRYGKQGLHVIGLNVGGPDDRSKVAGFVAEFNIPTDYTLGFPDPEMANLYLSDDDRIPQAWVFDRKGHLAKRFVSYDQSMPAQLEEVVQRALAAGAD
jgi:thiol-disulfide isomerase/thioredoxin